MPSLTRHPQLSAISLSKILFALSVPFTALALLCFALPVIGTVSGNYEEGMDGIGFYLFYAVLAAPAAVFIAGGIWLRGWKNAKFGKISLLVLFGLPAAVFTLLFAVAIIQNALEKKSLTRR